ncbi:mini-chromosome maintenance complex-binding protein [Nomia melanderi]|uniref:mini-chromosome maintenance complex-binding protein n=1 Tax=Nomia melanderi TaxID=2448451 RepID=UPI0013042DA6|nr:mini-chromosome maintenance complex-binding protein [Nomia melanderi]
MDIMTSRLNISDWTPEYFLANKSTCNVNLENPEIVKQIPCLNYVPLHYFTDRQLVRFQGMVQDMYNPEYYFQQYEVKNTLSKAQEIRSGMYADSARCLPHEEILVESEKNCSAERHTCVVISTPGLNEWAKERYEKSSCLNLNAVTNCKRNLEESTEEAMDCSEPVRKKDRILLNTESTENNVKEHNEDRQNIFSKEYLLNFPIPIDDGRTCIIKIYDDMALKLNEVIEIIGFVSLDPFINAYDTDETMTEAEMNVHHPPTSLVPRIHAIKLSRLSKEIESAPEIISKAKSIRNHLHLVLSNILFGDRLAADYLICHLLSSIYMRRDYFCLGTYPINITHFPANENKTFVEDLYKFLTMFVEKSHLLEITLENLNDLTLSPKKDYDSNRLTSGVLQLSDNTHLVIDETRLTPGQVSQAGRENYNTICDLINFQKVTYNFKFYKMEYETDIPVLILSEAKSFIPCQNQVVLKIDAESKNVYPHVIEVAEQYLKDENRLKDIRQYLKVVKDVKFQFNDDIVKEVQNDFVQLRQIHKNVNVDHLHSLMILARLLSLSYGSNTLTTEYWKMAVQMEMERLDRLPKKKEA